MSMTQNIQIVFEFATRHGTFRDALYLPVDHGLTDERIAEMQRERLNNWLAVVEAPLTEEVPPTEETPDA